jgi:hypothetical protein
MYVSLFSSLLPSPHTFPSVSYPWLLFLTGGLGGSSRLVFMTYNGWVMVAVSLGAFVGYLLFGHSTSATKDNACH